MRLQTCSPFIHPNTLGLAAKAMNMKIGNYLSNPEAPEWTERLRLGQVAKNQSGPGCWCLVFHIFGGWMFVFKNKVVII